MRQWRRKIGMRVLLMNDDYASAQSIELMLKCENFEVHTTPLGVRAIDLGRVEGYDIVLVDLNLPDTSHFEVLRDLRIADLKTPIVFVFRHAEIEEKLKGLGFLPGEYLFKPFLKDVLIARIKAIIRRSKGTVRPIIDVGDLSINLENKIVKIAGSRVYLTNKEFEVLELLSLRRGNTMTKEMFLNHLYGGLDEPDLKIIDVFVCNLRKKLANASNGKGYIKTVWGRGYVLLDPNIETTKISAQQTSQISAGETPAYEPIL